MTKAECRKCNAPMAAGKAMAQTFTAGSPDFPGDSRGMTISPGGPGKLVDCMKCTACGWSVVRAASELGRDKGETRDE